jgi:hypothetical protein
VKHNNRLSCVIPWKALFMDERNGRLSALPCCANWINRGFGSIENGKSLFELWNGPDAVEIRRLLAEGKQDELCAVDCPWLFSERFAEDTVGIVPGPPEFEANQRLNNQEIDERRTTLKSFPMAIRVIPTLHCNIRCRMCHQDHGADIRIPEAFMADVRNLGRYIYDYQLHGGEVLIDGRFRRWADPDWFAENPQMLLSLFTNATKIPKQTWNILQCLRVNYITVSINAATRETYKYIAGADLFDDVVQNAKALRELGLAHSLRQFQVFLCFVIMRSNYHELPAFVNVANRLELPFRLLLVEGDRKGESIYTFPPILEDILAVLDEAKRFALEESYPEIDRVHESLLASRTSETFGGSR